jgi:hypothetical protein
MRIAIKVSLIALCLSQIALYQPVLAQGEAITNEAPNSAARCSKETIETLSGSPNEIDAADTAGDSARVIQLTQKNIEIASLCLDELPDDAPSIKRVYLRNMILFSLSFELDASHGGGNVNKLFSSETRVAIDQCNESDLAISQDPFFVKARQLIGFVLDRDVKILTLSGTPIDDYRSDLRKCSIRLGRNDKF